MQSVQTSHSAQRSRQTFCVIQFVLSNVCYDTIFPLKYIMIPECEIKTRLRFKIKRVHWTLYMFSVLSGPKYEFDHTASMFLIEIRSIGSHTNCL